MLKQVQHDEGRDLDFALPKILNGRFASFAIFAISAISAISAIFA
jgi:hypothetical protein